MLLLAPLGQQNAITFAMIARINIENPNPLNMCKIKNYPVDLFLICD